MPGPQCAVPNMWYRRRKTMTVTMQLPGRVSPVWSFYRSDASFPNTIPFKTLWRLAFSPVLSESSSYSAVDWSESITEVRYDV